MKTLVRFYSIKEIKQMLNDNLLTEDFIEYLDKQNENIQKEIISLATDEVKRILLARYEIENQWEYTEKYEKKEVKQISLYDVIPDSHKQEYDEGIVFGFTKESKEEVQIPKEESQKELIDEQLETEDNPYKDLDFSKDIRVDELWVTVYDKGKCEIHNKLLVDINVKVRKSFGFYAKACDKCKKLYCSQEVINEIQPVLKKKNIEVHICEVDW